VSISRTQRTKNKYSYRMRRRWCSKSGPPLMILLTDLSADIVVDAECGVRERLAPAVVILVPGLQYTYLYTPLSSVGVSASSPLPRRWAALNCHFTALALSDSVGLQFLIISLQRESRAREQAERLFRQRGETRARGSRTTPQPPVPPIAASPQDLLRGNLFTRCRTTQVPVCECAHPSRQIATHLVSRSAKKIRITGMDRRL
jgi:hypothetical protein